ncbi:MULTISPECIES: DUF1415 domain-containing protein [Pigmentiphaga]|uniref:DUF1415 domain-containing protein n=1 Tax=Pigmentiphaga daeguensis TaxID=414049 RepID=A0ABN1CW80_9BURK|nr:MULTISPECIES: DUF1415 domain-containing protein [unclassified Pigmentiphaga]OVZ59008.1 hypothetical protein CDO46_24920 [Pigmentiphaga sp. NML030171]
MFTSPPDSLTHPAIIDATRAWLEKAVIGLNLCPFAKAVHTKGQIQYVVSDARDPDALLEELGACLRTLAQSDPEQVDTLLLIHPWTLADFYDYNEFLDEADAAVEALGLEGEIQVASFHPDYQFAGTGADDIENYSNRSPYPTLHLLREASVDKAVEAFPEAESIYERNIETLRELGHEGWKKLGL